MSKSIAGWGNRRECKGVVRKKWSDRLSRDAMKKQSWRSRESFQYPHAKGWLQLKRSRIGGELTWWQYQVVVSYGRAWCYDKFVSILLGRTGDEVARKLTEHTRTWPDRGYLGRTDWRSGLGRSQDRKRHLEHKHRQKPFCFDGYDRRDFGGGVDIEGGNDGWCWMRTRLQSDPSKNIFGPAEGWRLQDPDALESLTSGMSFRWTASAEAMAKPARRFAGQRHGVGHRSNYGGATAEISGPCIAEPRLYVNDPLPLNGTGPPDQTCDPLAQGQRPQLCSAASSWPNGGIAPLHSLPTWRNILFRRTRLAYRQVPQRLAWLASWWVAPSAANELDAKFVSRLLLPRFEENAVLQAEYSYFSVFEVVVVISIYCCFAYWCCTTRGTHQ